MTHKSKYYDNLSEYKDLNALAESFNENPPTPEENDEAWDIIHMIYELRNLLKDE